MFDKKTVFFTAKFELLSTIEQMTLGNRTSHLANTEMQIEVAAL